MAGISGLQERNLCGVRPHYLLSLIVTTRAIGCPTHGGWYSSERRAVPRAFRDALIFILASHEPNSLWPRCASNVCSGSLRALVSQSLHSLFERKLLVSHFKIPIRPLIRDDQSIHYKTAER